jgi:hypothetical protein
VNKNKDNYFQNFSSVKHESSYMYEIKMSNNDSYSFIGVDAALNTGINFPFNFYGYLKHVNYILDI